MSASRAHPWFLQVECIDGPLAGHRSQWMKWGTTSPASGWRVGSRNTLDAKSATGAAGHVYELVTRTTQPCDNTGTAKYVGPSEPSR